MAQSILVFDFGANEEAAQQAKHKVEGWKQGFRLGNKMLLKFNREQLATEETTATAQDQSAEPPKAADGAPKGGKKKVAAKSGAKAKAKSSAESETSETSAEPNGKVSLLVRLDFSDHEKLSHQRWLDRIPSEEPFKSASGQTIRTGDPEYPKTAELFESLD